MTSLFYATYSSLHCKTCSIELTTTASCLSHYCTTLSVTMKTAFVLITLQNVFICLYFVCVSKLKGQVS